MTKREEEVVMACQVLKAAYLAMHITGVEPDSMTKLLMESSVIFLRELSRVCEETDYQGFEDINLNEVGKKTAEETIKDLPTKEDPKHE